MAKAKKPNAKDVQLSARTDAATKERLRALADQGYSESEIIDAAVRQYLNQELTPVTIQMKAYGSVREFEIVERHEGGGYTTHYFPLKLKAYGQGLELDLDRCPDPEMDLASFCRVVSKWNESR